MTEHYTKISDNAALRVASALDITPDAKLIEAVDTESERQELIDLVKEMPIGTIRDFLQQLKINKI